MLGAIGRQFFPTYAEYITYRGNKQISFHVLPTAWKSNQIKSMAWLFAGSTRIDREHDRYRL
jgi:hypothetical protein